MKRLSAFQELACLARENEGLWMEWPEPQPYNVARMRSKAIVAGNYIHFPKGFYATKVSGGILWVKYLGKDK